MAVPQWVRGLSRLSPFGLFADQFRFLTSASSNKPDWLVRVIVLATAPVMFGVSMLFGWQAQSVGELVGALGLLAGVFISAFALVFGLRINLAARPTKVLDRKSARLMDESALSLLAAGVVAGADSIWLAAISVMRPDDQAVMATWATGVTVGLSSLVVVYFLLAVRRMHKLYTDTFVPFWRVADAVTGPKEQKLNGRNRAATDVDARRNS